MNIFDQKKIQNRLRIFSAWVSFLTFVLIFLGALVNSTGSGLAVPDWPLSYGSLFPPMIGGVVYEHTHRMVAAAVGFLTLILAISLALYEKRRWVKILGFCALGAVILQGVLGGITVLLFLPVGISVLHGVLAQTFFVLTIIIAYSQSNEFQSRLKAKENLPGEGYLKAAVALLVLIYLQLIIAAVMRHTHSGLAIPDFPRMGGYFFPPFNDSMLKAINYDRFLLNLSDVQMWQVVIHFIHRLGAAIISILVLYLTMKTWAFYKTNQRLVHTILILDNLILLQIVLGILTVLTVKSPWVTSIHVVNGAAILGSSVIFLLRLFPIHVFEKRDVA